VLRKIKGVTIEARVGRVEPVSVESRTHGVEKEVYQPIKDKLMEEPVQRREELQSRIIDVLMKNPSYVQDLKEIKSKYRK